MNDQQHQPDCQLRPLHNTPIAGISAVFHRYNGRIVQDAIPLVLIHGFPVDSRMWDDMIAKLLPLGGDFPIITMDMPGAGNSEPLSLEKTGNVAEDGAYTEALDAVADEFVAKLQALGFTKAVWAGLSMGGYVALAIVRRHPEAVAGLALCDTNAHEDSEEQRAKRLTIADHALATSSVEDVLHFKEAHRYKKSVFSSEDFDRNERFENMFDDWIRMQAPAGIAWRERMAAGRPNQEAVLSAITCPTLVLAGEHDPSSTPELMKQLALTIGANGNPKVRFETIANAGHFSAFEQPVAVASALYKLMEQC